MLENPFPGDMKLLKGQQKTFRRRVGSWRIFFFRAPNERRIVVSAIERRSSTTYWPTAVGRVGSGISTQFPCFELLKPNLYNLTSPVANNSPVRSHRKMSDLLLTGWPRRLARALPAC